MNVVANETAILHRQWLLQDILPEALNELKIQVEKSLDILFNEGQPDALPVSSLKDESIKGFITLEKLSITKAELLVQLPHYNQDNPTKVVMNTDNPYRLEQAQQGINYIALAAKRLQRLDTSAWSSKQAVTELLDSICRDIDRARLAFEHPNDAERFPYKVCQPKKFNPPLKEDLVVEFYIKDVYVVCNAIALEFRQGKNAASNVDTQNNYISYKDKYATIIHQSQVQTQSPMLTELKASLKAIRESCLHHRQLLLQIDA